MVASEKRVRRATVRLAVAGGVFAVVAPASVAVLAQTGVPDLTGGGGFPLQAYLALAALSLVPSTVLGILGFSVLIGQKLTRHTLIAMGEVVPGTVSMIPAVGLIEMLTLEGMVGDLSFGALPPVWETVLQALAYLLVADLLFYLAHRALHTKALYKVHLTHHLQKAPCEPASSLSLSILDWHVEGLLLFFAPVLLVDVHVCVWLGCGMVTLLAALYNHADALTWLRIPMVNGPIEHQLHHHLGRDNHNFALLFTVWDRLFGTYRVPAGGKTEAMPWATRGARR